MILIRHELIFSWGKVFFVFVNKIMLETNILIYDKEKTIKNNEKLNYFFKISLERRFNNDLTIRTLIVKFRTIFR